MFKKIALTALIGAALISAAGCGGSDKKADSSAASGAKKVTIGFSVSTQNNPFFVTMANSVKAAAEKAGVNVKIVDAQNDPAKQSNDIADLLQGNISVLIVNPVDSAAVSNSVLAANKAKIPVITIDRASDKGEVAVHIASNNIKGGEITATGGVSLDSRNHSDKWLSGAGIGSGSNVSGETEINISGDSTIKSASGGKYGGAGIGSGSGDTKNDSKKGAVTINITDGTIEKAEGKDGGAGIGSGYYGRSSTVNISGNAELKDVKGGNLAAGIGSGYDSDKVDVVIDGGTINATGGDSAAGIGSGHNSRSSVIIKSGTVNATGNGTGAGIGGSYEGRGRDIYIYGGDISATGGTAGAGIGGGCWTSEQDMDGDTAAYNINIYGGKVYACGSYNGAGIGGGQYVPARDITITGGEVNAHGAYGAAIGGGYSGGGTGGSSSGFGRCRDLGFLCGFVRSRGCLVGAGCSVCCLCRRSVASGFGGGTRGAASGGGGLGCELAGVDRVGSYVGGCVGGAVRGARYGKGRVRDSRTCRLRGTRRRPLGFRGGALCTLCA